MTCLSASSRVYVAGHRGMVGSAVVRALQDFGVREIITRSRSELDLTNQAAVDSFYAESKPEIVVFAAARVGGIHANNSYPAEFAYENLSMATNAVHSAFRHQVARFLFLGSTCIYPRDCPQPMKEESLLTGPLEPTNEAYALAKIAGLKLCQYYRRQYGRTFHSAMPTNLYGPGDNYHPENSHVLPALIRRFHEAKAKGAPTVTIWGTGTPRREFLHVDDLACGLLKLLTIESPPDWVNLGTGADISIRELAELVAATTGFAGDVNTDPTKPDGTPIKCSDISLIRSLGWEPKISLQEGIEHAYECFQSELQRATMRSF